MAVLPIRFYDSAVDPDVRLAYEDACKRTGEEEGNTIPPSV